MKTNILIRKVVLLCSICTLLAVVSSCSGRSDRSYEHVSNEADRSSNLDYDSFMENNSPVDMESNNDIHISGENRDSNNDLYRSNQGGIEYNNLEEIENNMNQNELQNGENNTSIGSIQSNVSEGLIQNDVYEAFAVVDSENLSLEEIDLYFNQTEITEHIFKRINGISYKEDGLIQKEELTYLQVLHYGFDNKTHIGEIIVNKKIAADVLDIFRDLYQANYPIERMVLVDEYNGDDNLSMAANNSSSFNYRVIDGTNKLSKHSRGLAIDINPLYNPYVRTREGEEEVLPIEAAEYTDRIKDFPYYIKKDDVCYQAFQKRGFQWGGEWTSSKDYQHFDITID